jgi:hypothetical protein
MKYYEKGVKLGSNHPVLFNEEEWSACNDRMIHLPTGRLYSVHAGVDEFGNLDPWGCEAKLVSTGTPLPNRSELRLQALQAISVFIVSEGSFGTMKLPEEPRFCRTFRRSRLSSLAQ